MATCINLQASAAEHLLRPKADTEQILKEFFLVDNL